MANYVWRHRPVIDLPVDDAAEDTFEMPEFNRPVLEEDRIRAAEKTRGEE